MAQVVKFTQELKDRWIEHYSNVEHCALDFRIGNCFCAYGALYDLLVQDGIAEWHPICKDQYYESFGDLNEIMPYFSFGEGVQTEIWNLNDDLVREGQNPIPEVVELIKQIPVEE